MRMNRGTIALVVLCIVVIIGVLLVNNNQANAPSNTTPSPSAETGGPLFTGLDVNTLVRFEVRDNTNGARTVLTKNQENVWGLDESDLPGAGDVTSDPLSGVVVEATDEAEGTTGVSAEDSFSVQTTSGQILDQSVILTDIGSFLSLNATDSFTSDQLADFGLDQPRYTVLVTADSGTVYQLHVGGQNPTGVRYYTVLEQLAGADVATEEAGATQEPGALATTVNEQGESSGAVGENIIGGADLNEVAGTDEAEAEVVASVTEAIELGDALEATNAANLAANEAEATEAAAGTADSGGEAVATQDVEAGESSGLTDENIIGGVDPSEVTAEATLEVTPEVSAPVLPTPTLAPLAEPLVSLQGSQTIYTLPKNTLDTLIRLITTIPFATPTPVPTSQVPLPETTVEAVPEVEVTPEAEATAAP